MDGRITNILKPTRFIVRDHLFDVLLRETCTAIEAQNVFPLQVRSAKYARGNQPRRQTTREINIGFAFYSKHNTNKKSNDCSRYEL